MKKDGHLYASFISWYVKVTCVPTLNTDVSAGDVAWDSGVVSFPGCEGPRVGAVERGRGAQEGVLVPRCIDITAICEVGWWREEGGHMKKFEDIVYY